MSTDEKDPRGDQPRDDGADSPTDPVKPEGAKPEGTVPRGEGPEGEETGGDGPGGDEAADGSADAPEPSPEQPAESPGAAESPGDSESADGVYAASAEAASAEAESTATKPTTAYYDDPYDDYDYEYDDPEVDKGEKALVKSETATEPVKTPPPPPPPTTDLDEDDEDGMARMSFLEHLEELRVRIIRALIGLVVAYLTALAFAPNLFKLFVRPFEQAALPLPYDPPLTLVQLTPTEQFYLEYVKIPLLAGLFIGAPWLMMQAWGFISPGLYKRERRWAMPFIVSTAGLFIAGGLFCYFVAMRFALTFLMGLAFEPGVRPMISLTSYYDMFFNLHVGLGAVFQMPIVIFFLTLLRITSPGFLFRNGRYAILVIFLVAAVITPTPDVTTMLTFAAPMILLYYFGIGVSYIIVMKREGKAFPWKIFLLIMLGVALAVAAVMAVMYYQMDFRFTPHWPFFVGPA